MTRFPCVASYCLLALLVASAPASAQGRPLVLRARVADQAIGPGTARYIIRVIGEAEARKAACVVVALDTPGGLLDSTRDIVKRILDSRVPVIVHVAPPGARAASAGAFITLAAHKAAMARGTNIGAAHPVQAVGLPVSRRRGHGDVMGDKVVNDTAAWAKALALLRKRNETWAESAVRDSLSTDAQDAVREHAVDLLADDTAELLKGVDGQSVLVQGAEVVLQTKDAEVQEVPMWWGEQFLATITNPNIAFLLLIFGFFGVLIEWKAPGWFVPGILGAICLVLGLMALSVLPVNFGGLALILVALGLFVAEGFVTTHGILAVGGLICLGLGGTMLVDSPEGFERVSLFVIAPVGLAVAFVTVFLVNSIVKAHRAKVQTGGEAMLGMEVVALEPFSLNELGYRGAVRVNGEIWKAISPTPLATGQVMEVESREGLTLYLRPPLGQPTP